MKLKDGEVTVNVGNLSLVCSGNAALSSAVPGFKEAGRGYFNLSEFNLTSTFSLTKGKSRLVNVKLHRVKTDISNSTFTIGLFGAGVIFETLNTVKDTFLRLFIAWLEGEMSAREKQIIENATNKVMNEESPLVAVGSDVALDCGLTDPPIVTSHIAFLMNGTGVCVNPATCKGYEGRRPSWADPVSPFDGLGSMTVLVCDYVVNSLLVAAVQRRLLDAVVESKDAEEWLGVKLDTSLIGIFIPEIMKEYGEGKEVIIEIQTHEAPVCGFSLEKGIQGRICDEKIGDAKSTLKMFVRDKVLIRVLVLEVSLKMGGKVKAAKNNLTGEITNHDLKLQLISSPIKIESIGNLEKTLQLVLALGIPQVNGYLKAGIAVPYIGPFFSLEKSELKIVDRYIKVSVNLAPVPSSREENNAVERVLAKMLNRS